MTQPDRARGAWLRIVLGIAVSVGMIWFAFRDTRLGDVWDELDALRVVPMLAAVVVATLPFALRVPRWRLLLRHDDGSPIGARPMWHAIAVGFAANNVLPLRLGEVVRMGAIARLAPVAFPSALSSVAVERILDALVAVGLFGVGLLVVDLPLDPVAADRATWIAVFALAALVGAIVVARWPALARRPVMAIVPAGRLREALLGFLDRVIGGLAALGDPRHAVPVIAWSLVVWLVNAAAFWLAFGAFGIEVPYAGALVLQGALLVGIAVPSSPGYAGVFEAAIALTLTGLFGVREELALAYAVTYHLLTFIPITVLGVVSLLSTGLTFRAAREAAA